MEHWERLCEGGLKFVYGDGAFPPSTDSFLLSSLPRLKKGCRVCDLGCGTGLLGILLLQRQRQITVTGVELNEEAAALGQSCAAENGLGDHLIIRQGDLRQVRQFLPAGRFDLVVCNPPYYPPQSGRTAEKDALRRARAEVTCTLEDVCAAASYLLHWGGRLCLVQKPARLTDVLCALRACGLEPKQLRFVCRRAGDAPSLVLVEGCRGGKSGLTVPPPLILEDASGAPTQEVDAIYFRKEETP